MNLTSLRQANTTRQVEWTGAANNVPLPFRAVELTGEVGEVLNVAKKLYRARAAWPGSRATLQDLENELADVVICCDLLAMDLGIHLEDHHTDIYAGDLLLLTVKLGTFAGKVCQGVEAAHYGSVRQSKEIISTALDSAVKTALSIASVESILLWPAVVKKFNATSEKVGLATRLVL